MNFPQQTPAEFIAEIERAGTRRATPAGQGEIVWRVFGRGEPLVLLHGGTGSWLHWVRNIEALAADFMLLVPDIPGSGESGNPQPPITAREVLSVHPEAIFDLNDWPARACFQQCPPLREGTPGCLHQEIAHRELPLE